MPDITAFQDDPLGFQADAFQMGVSVVVGGGRRKRAKVHITHDDLPWKVKPEPWKPEIPERPWERQPEIEVLPEPPVVPQTVITASLNIQGVVPQVSVRARQRFLVHSASGESAIGTLRIGEVIQRFSATVDAGGEQGQSLTEMEEEALIRAMLLLMEE